MHGHTLVWGSSTPDWMNYSGNHREEAVENLTTHIKTVVEHFKGKVISWDVVNEAIINGDIATPSDWRSALIKNNWYHALGPEYIEMAFIAAREADSDIKLYYNDNNLNNQDKALAVYNMVKEIDEQFPDVNGRPLIDGIGMQGHYRVKTHPYWIRISLEKFISLGVEVSISELDISIDASNFLKEKQPSVLSEDMSIEQGRTYALLFNIFRQHADKIGRVSFGGIDDATSWMPSMHPTLFDSNLKAKHAFYGVRDTNQFIMEFGDDL
jgi:endo-1,4-beta-xylanase